LRYEYNKRTSTDVLRWNSWNQQASICVKGH